MKGRLVVLAEDNKVVFLTKSALFDLKANATCSILVSSIAIETGIIEVSGFKVQYQRVYRESQHADRDELIFSQPFTISVTSN